MSLLEEFAAQSNANKEPMYRGESRGSGFTLAVAVLLLVVGLVLLVIGVLLLGPLGIIPGLIVILVAAFLGLAPTDGCASMAFVFLIIICALAYKAFTFFMPGILLK